MKIKVLILFSLILLLSIFIQCESAKAEFTNIETVTPLQHDWDYAVPHQEIPEGLTSLSAESCGECHQEHYKEWQYSTHSHAWTDLQFQAELKKETSPFMCINCHIPLQNQQEYIVKGLINGDIYQPYQVKNPHFDEALQQEGINCASCHVRNNVIVGPTGTDKAPHATVKDTIHLSEQLCISCHNAVASINTSLECTFETGDEWKQGKFYGEKNCINCHMDTITRSIVPGFDERLSHRHYFPGSGIPKFADKETKMLTGLAFYPEDLHKSFIKGQSINFNFRIKNEFAGHKVPTADPERFILFNFLIVDHNNDTIYTQEERIGEEWEWHPAAKKISDNNLLPQEERTYHVNYLTNKKGTYKLIINVSKHRMTKASANYNKLGDNYPLSIDIYSKTFEFRVK